MNIVDLRSDTVTRPTEAMYDAMRSALLGDDVLGDDPTVHEFESLAAEMLGKEAAMFVPSGSMGNQIALAVHTRPGDAAIFEDEAHMLFYEGGAPGVIAQVVTRTVKGEKGVMPPEEVRKKILVRTMHTPGTVVLCVENSHNRASGAVIPLDVMREYQAIAVAAGMKVHCDGARIFNAAAALGCTAKDIASHVETVNFCLSKGLGSPIGSVLCGPADFIDAARYWRKRLGGGMRQAGLLAACGLVSLRTMVSRLGEDHARAKRLASSLAKLDGLSVDVEGCPTNIVMVDTVQPANEWVAKIKEQGVWALPMGANRVRLVVHHQVDDSGIEQAIHAFAS